MDSPFSNQLTAMAQATTVDRRSKSVQDNPKTLSKTKLASSDTIRITTPVSFLEPKTRESPPITTTKNKLGKPTGSLYITDINIPIAKPNQYIPLHSNRIKRNGQ